MPSPTPRRTKNVLVTLVLQALVWTALAVAFATLLVVAGPQSWSSAIRFSALNWMPWAVLTPLVFWFSLRFPLERGHLRRSVPAHLIGSAICVTITISLAAYFTFNLRPLRIEERTPIERSPSERDASHRPAVPPGPEDPQHVAPPRPERPDRAERYARGEHREPFARRGPFWWFFFGASMLRANFDIAVYIIVVAAAHAVSFYRRAQDRERHAIALTAGLNRAKLDALRLQLQPHFLFNTLNAISTLVHRDASAADELIGDLSELLRLSLQTAEHEVPLSRELELLDCYIAIEQTRLGDRLRVVREIEPQVKGAFVPTFVLQPLVENAVRHGIEPRLAPGTVTIRALRVGDNLQLTVSDDGVGLGRGTTSSTPARRGIGINNTEERLRALHGKAAQLEIQEPSTGGVTVQITLPFVTTPHAEPASNIA